jgi:hypothetical protein
VQALNEGKAYPAKAQAGNFEGRSPKLETISKFPNPILGIGIYFGSENHKEQ